MAGPTLGRRKCVLCAPAQCWRERQRRDAALKAGRRAISAL